MWGLNCTTYCTEISAGFVLCQQVAEHKGIWNDTDRDTFRPHSMKKSPLLCPLFSSSKMIIKHQGQIFYWFVCFWIGENGVRGFWKFSNSVLHIVWKLLKVSHLNFLILAFSTNFCPIKSALSGNTVWQQTSDLQKLAKIDHFCLFIELLSTQCKCSSLRSKCWIRLFLWFSNTVIVC